MKFKSLLSSAALILVVIVNAIFLGSAQARCISNNCGRYGGQRLLSSWEPTHRGYHLTRPSIFDHMSELFTFPSQLNSLLESQQRQLTNLYSSPSPRYHISENENSVDITMDLPGVRVSDVSLTLEDEGHSLKISGSRKYQVRGETVKSEFQQIFRIDPLDVDVQSIEAKLQDGVLHVSANRFQKRDRNIAIEVTETGGNTEAIKKVEDVKTDSVNLDSETMEGSYKGIIDDLEISAEEDI